MLELAEVMVVAGDDSSDGVGVNGRNVGIVMGSGDGGRG